MDGDADIASVAAAIADPGRSRMLMALGDGRALTAGVLAGEAGVAASTASAHLAKLVGVGLLHDERHGRHRYFRLAGPEVGAMIEALARVAPAAPVRSLRQGTRANAVRTARTCYDHLAGQLGTGLMSGLLQQGILAGGDGRFHHARARRDRLSAPGNDIDYRLTRSGRAALTEFGMDLDSVESSRRQTVRYCIDWSEQRHHLAGGLGAALADRMFDLDWLRRGATHRAVRVTPDGKAGLLETFGVATPR